MYIINAVLAGHYDIYFIGVIKWKYPELSKVAADCEEFSNIPLRALNIENIVTDCATLFASAFVGILFSIVVTILLGSLNSTPLPGIEVFGIVYPVTISRFSLVRNIRTPQTSEFINEGTTSNTLLKFFN